MSVLEEKNEMRFRENEKNSKRQIAIALSEFYSKNLQVDGIIGDKYDF